MQLEAQESDSNTRRAFTIHASDSDVGVADVERKQG